MSPFLITACCSTNEEAWPAWPANVWFASAAARASVAGPGALSGAATLPAALCPSLPPPPPHPESATRLTAPTSARRGRVIFMVVGRIAASDGSGGAGGARPVRVHLGTWVSAGRTAVGEWPRERRETRCRGGRWRSRRADRRPRPRRGRPVRPPPRELTRRGWEAPARHRR